MFWTKVSKAMSDIIMVVALVMALMLGEGFAKMLDSTLAGIVGFVLGIVITIGAGVALKSLTKTSDTILILLNKLEGNGQGNIIPSSLEAVEALERLANEMAEHDHDASNSGEETFSNELPPVNVRWMALSMEIKAVWIEVFALVIGTLVLAFRVSQKTQYGAILILGFGLVANMLVNAIIGTAVENHHKMERVKYLMRTRNTRKNKE